MTPRTWIAAAALLCACSGAQKPATNLAPENRLANFDNRDAQEVRYRFYADRGDMLQRGADYFPSTDGATSCDLRGDAIEEAMFGSSRQDWAASGFGITAVTVSVIDGDCQGNILVGSANVVVTYGFADRAAEGATETTWLVGEFGPDGMISGTTFRYSTNSLSNGEWIAVYQTKPNLTVKFEFNGQQTKSIVIEHSGDHDKTLVYFGDQLVGTYNRVFGLYHGPQQQFGAAPRSWCAVLGEEVDASRCEGELQLTEDEQAAYAAKAEASSAAVAHSAPTKGSSGPWPSLEGLVTKIGGGEQDAAVVIGIEDYTFVSDVPGATMNARDWYRYLTQGRNVPTSNVKLLLDASATDDAIRAALRDMVARVGRDGTLWFVFIGHGAPAMNQRDGLLVGVDAQQTARGLYGRSVPLNEVLTSARGSHQNTVLIVDACFSGRTASGELAPGLQPLLAVEHDVPTSGALIFSAGASDQFAGPLPRANRPAFSYLMLGGLLGWADGDGDGVIASAELLDFVDGTLSGLLTDRDQTPQLTPRADVPLTTSAGAAAVDVAAIALQ